MAELSQEASDLVQANPALCQKLGIEAAYTSPAIKDETGNRYGKLLVLERVGGRLWGQAAWRCKCDCGNEAVVAGNQLRTGRTRSCGCLANQSLPKGVAAFNKLYRDIERSAARRNHHWALSKEEVRILTSQPCYYCGAEPLQVFTKNANGAYYYNGLDRIDNTLGYTADNVVPCCGFCNRARGLKTQEEFLYWLLSAYKRFLEGQKGKAFEELG